MSDIYSYKRTTSFIVDMFQCTTKADYLGMLCYYFGINIGDIKNYVKVSNDIKTAYDFIKYFDINMQKDYYYDVFIVCKHFTTIYDSFSSIKKFGLINLIENLKNKNTSLSRFLIKHGVQINLQNKSIEYKGKTYNLIPYSDSIHDYKLLNEEKKLFSDYDYKDSIEKIYNKLYVDKV